MRVLSHAFLVFMTTCIIVMDVQGQQDVTFEQIAQDDGLSQSTGRCILQDHKGFLWIGTENGLNKYDGAAITIFRHDPDDPRSLRDSQIWALRL